MRLGKLGLMECFVEGIALHGEMVSAVSRLATGSPRGDSRIREYHFTHSVEASYALRALVEISRFFFLSLQPHWVLQWAICLTGDSVARSGCLEGDDPCSARRNYQSEAAGTQLRRQHFGQRSERMIRGSTTWTSSWNDVRHLRPDGFDSIKTVIVRRLP